MHRQARKAQPLRHGRRRDGGVGGDADHAVDLADLAIVAFGGGGGFRRAIDVRDQAGIGEGKAGRLGVDVRHHDVESHLLGAPRGVRGFDAARDDQQGLAAAAHRKCLFIRSIGRR